MKLRNAPLAQVIAQVVFSPVLNWLEAVPRIQDQLIDVGFPRVSRRDLTELTFTVSGPSATTIKPRFVFSDKSERTVFVLAESSLALLTTNYSSREPFLQTLRRGLEILNNTLKLSLTKRVGLRYIDFVQPNIGEDFSAYVHKGLLGYPFEEAGSLRASLIGFATQSVAKTDLGTLAIRSTILPQGSYLPPDLEPGVVVIPPRGDQTRPGLAVDFDHFSVFVGGESSEPDFSPDMIVNHMNRLHGDLRKSFDVIVTKHAISQWGPWES